MKIAMIAPTVESEKGIALYSSDLVDAIKKNSIDIDLLQYKRKSFFSLLKLIFKLKSYDVVHLQHEFGLFGMLGLTFFPLFLLMRLFSRGKLVTTIHTVYSKAEKVSSFFQLLSWLRARMLYSIHYGLINLLSDRVVVHASFLRDDIIEFGMRPEKVFVIPQGAKTKVPRFSKQSAKKQLGLTGPVYLSIGNITPLKGFDVLVKNAKAIGRTIIIAGTATNAVHKIYLDSLIDYVNKNNLNNIVKFYVNPDFNARQKLWWLYFSAADIVLLPYKKMTTSGIFINAVESRKPVVGTDSRYFREISDKYGCVKVVKNESDYPTVVKDAMHNLKKMEAGAQKFYKDNNLDTVGKKYKELYESISV